MKFKDLVQFRLQNHALESTYFTNPAQVVEHFLAVQAQDYLGSLWAVGQRIGNATEAIIERAISDKTIIRSWPMRGTLHLVSPKDIRWMLILLSQRVMVRATVNYRKAELTKEVFSKSRKIVTKALEGNKVLTRLELYAALEKAKVSTDQERGIHILGNLALNQLICFGPRQGKQHTFVLLDEWVPDVMILSRDESLAALTQRYFQSHGPATLQDFNWWSGLAPEDAKRGIEMCKSSLRSTVIENMKYWFLEKTSSSERNSTIKLLPSYDEYTVAYKDRTPVLDANHAVITRNGIFSPVVLIKGRIGGIWTRSFSKAGVTLDVKCLIKPTATQAKSLKKEIRRYCDFLEVPLANETISLPH